MKFSAYRNIRTTVPYGELDLERFIVLVKDPSERIQGILTAARNAYAAGNKAAYDNQKAELWCVTPWGLFTQRKADACKSKSGVFVIDVDGHDQKLKKTPAQWGQLRDGLKATGKFAAGFISPSGDGLKLFVRVADTATPLGTVKEVAAYLEKNWMVDADESGKDASRACFVSWDQEAFYVAESEEWTGKEPTHYTLDESKSAFAKVVSDATAEEIAEDNDAKFTRYLNHLQNAGRLCYADWQQTIEACVGQWDESRAVAEMTSRWADEKPGETAYRASKANPCPEPCGSLWKVLERNGLTGQARQENREQKIKELRAAKKVDAEERKAAAPKAEESDSPEEAEAKKQHRLQVMAEHPKETHLWDGMKPTTRKLQLAAIAPNTDDIYYDGPNRYMYDGGDCFILRGASDIKETLKTRGFAAKPENGEAISEVNAALMYIQTKRYVSYAGPLAGKMKGLYKVNTRQLLATSSPELIEPEEGECPLLDELVNGLFLDGTENGEKQKRFFFGWLKTAYETLRIGEHRCGQALVLAGKRNCGKTLMKSIIVKLLGNRTANPFSYMTGLTRFNSDLAGAECLCIDDATGLTDQKTRAVVAAKLKEMLFSQSISIENKGREPFQFEPFWRMIFCVNDEPKSLMVLPTLSEDVEDKISLIQCGKWESSIPNTTQEERKAFDLRIQEELPAFLHKVLQFEIPEEEKESRCGIKFFHHPDLLETLKTVAPEIQFLDLVYEVGKQNLAIYQEPRTAREWERIIKDGGVHYAKELEQICGWSRASFSHLSNLAKRGYAKKEGVRTMHGYKWTIFSPEDLERKRRLESIQKWMDSGHWFEVGQQVVLCAEEYDWKTEVTGARNGDTATVVGRDDDTNAYNVRNSEWAKKPGSTGDFPSGVITVGGWALKALPAETGD